MDALIAVLTASMCKRGLKTIPENPEIDSKGLSMQIIYPPGKLYGFHNSKLSKTIYQNLCG